MHFLFFNPELVKYFQIHILNHNKTFHIFFILINYEKHFEL